jgi:alpha-beta hydrolase superfamily lysophospholipase
MKMKNTQFQWKSFDGLNLFAQLWQPETKPHAVVNLVHGMGEHSTRYHHWAERFVNKGFAVVAFDLRGHGQSDGKLGHIPSFEALMRDVDLLFEEQKKLFPEIPVYLYGHSLGGNLVLNYALHRKPHLQGLIATSPWLELAMQPSKALLAFAKIAKNIMPALQQDTKLNADFLSQDKNEVQKYKQDKLVHGKISINMFFEVVKAGIWALENAKSLNIKTLILHGTGDQITSHKASERFAQAASEFAHAKLWQGAYHELHHEEIRNEVFEYIINNLKLV